MKPKLALLSALLPAFVFLTPDLVRAQDASDAFARYTDPHGICDYYRTQAGWIVERESGNECLVSLGSGKYKNFTQYYYSGSNWCYKLYSGSEVVSSLCIQRTGKSEVFTKEEFTKFAPYIVGVVVLIIILAVVSSIKPPASPTQQPSGSTKAFRQPRAIRSKRTIPKKRVRIWPELSRWFKFGHKK